MRYCNKCGAEITGRFCTACGNDCQAKKENVEETLGKLYTLRAGISYVSKENGIYIHEDHINKSNYNLIKGQIANNERDVRNMHKQQLSNIAARELYNESLHNELNHSIECEKNNQKIIVDNLEQIAKSNEKRKGILGFVGGICGILIFLINPLASLISDIFDVGFGAAMIIHFAIVATLFVGALILGEMLRITNKHNIEKLKKEHGDSTARLAEIESRFNPPPFPW